MTKLLLVPLDDIVVFPNMNVTLTVEVGDEDRVLLVPKHEGEYAAVGTVARVTDRVRLPGGAIAVAIEGLHRGIAGAAETDSQGRLLVEVEERKDGIPTDERTRELETEYRAVVEEILELRGDDGRIQSFVRSITDAGPARRHVGLLARPELRRRRCSCSRPSTSRSGSSSPSRSSASGSRPCRSASGSARTSTRAWRSSSASTCSASRWTRSARSSARTTHRSSTSTGRRSRRRGCPRPCASRPTRSSPASSGWARARPSRR